MDHDSNVVIIVIFNVVTKTCRMGLRIFILVFLFLFVILTFFTIDWLSKP